MPQHPFARGLAVSAVAALAVSGLGSAAHAADPADPMVTILSQFTHRASTRPVAIYSPGAITLTAEVADPSATVAFEYNLDAAAGNGDDGWTSTGTASTVLDGFATSYWTPEDLGGRTVAIRASATTTDATTYSTRNDVTITGAPPVDTVSLFNYNNILVSGPEGSSYSYNDSSYFRQPYADSGRTATLM